MTVRECYFCKTKFETSFRNHGTKYKEKTIYICSDCIYIEKTCEICGKKYRTKHTKSEKSKFCSQDCSRKHATQIMAKSIRFGKSEFCNICNEITKHYKNGACVKCVTTNARAGDYLDFCIECNKETVHYVSGICVKCASEGNLEKARLKNYTPEIIKRIEKTMKENGEYEKRNARIHSKEVIAIKIANGSYKRLSIAAHTPEANKAREDSLIASGAANKRNARLKTFTDNINHQKNAANSKILNKIKEFKSLSLYREYKIIETKVKTELSKDEFEIWKNNEHAIRHGYKSYIHEKFMNNKKLIEEFKTFNLFKKYKIEEKINKLYLTKDEFEIWKNNKHAIRYGYNSYEHKQFYLNNSLIKEFKTYELLKEYKIQENKNKLCLSKEDFTAWRINQHFIRQGFESLENKQFMSNKELIKEFKTWDLFKKYKIEENKNKLLLTDSEFRTWERNNVSIRYGYESFQHKIFTKNKSLIKEFKTWDLFKKYKINENKLKLQLSKDKFKAWRIDQHAIRLGFISSTDMWCYNKRQKLKDYFKTDNIEKIINILSDSSINWNVRQNKVYRFIMELGNIDYFAGKRISDNELIFNDNCNIAVYGIKIIKDKELIYIGTSSNFLRRKSEHILNIKNEQYNQISKYITKDMIEGIDWSMVKLVTPPDYIIKSSIYKIQYWLSLVECQLIHKYKTNIKANNETGTW